MNWPWPIRDKLALLDTSVFFSYPIFGFDSRPKYKDIRNIFLKDYSKLTELVFLTDNNKYIAKIFKNHDIQQ